MERKNLVAYYIWQAREEVGMDGNEEHDWWLAERFLNSYGTDSFEYTDIYMWVMENA